MQYEGQLIVREREFAAREHELLDQCEKMNTKNEQLREQIKKGEMEKKSVTDSMISMK